MSFVTPPAALPVSYPAVMVASRKSAQNVPHFVPTRARGISVSSIHPTSGRDPFRSPVRRFVLCHISCERFWERRAKQ